MATPVPPNKNPTPKEYLPPPPTPELSQPDDYRKTVRAHKDHRVVSKVSSSGPYSQEGWAVRQLLDSYPFQERIADVSSSTRVRRRARRVSIASSGRTTTRPR